MCNFSEDNKQKLGYAIIYIAERTKRLSKTKLLKLLFIMEETMVKKFRTPFLSIPYEVWQAGPVPKDLFIDLSDGPFILRDYVATYTAKNCTYIQAKKPFMDDEFSDCEIEMMNDVLKKYGNKTAKELVNELHKEGSLWWNTANKNNLLDSFNQGLSNNSDVQIDFSDALVDKEKDEYRDSLAIHQTANFLKAKGSV